jgi:LuxR family maltose regulon positive regulatory protein
VLAAAGRVDEALDWARTHGLTANDELSYMREYEHVTLARVLLASGATQQALDLLDRLLAAAEEGGRTGTALEILVLQALALRDVAPLERALALAEPDGWIRVFAGEGGPMRELLGRVPGSPFRQGILGAMQGDVPQETHPSKPDQSPLIDPLSERELEVLRLLASELDGPDIARHLVVSLNTVRTHTKHIYTKLDVNSRRSAVAKANQLGLLTR